MTILVIGAGSVGTRHFNNLKSLGAAAELLSIRAIGIDGVIQRLKSLDINGAVIATETQLRLELIRLCAERHYPLYIEKPLTHSIRDFGLIRHACKPVAKRSMLGYMMRYHPAFQYLAAADLSDIYRYRFEIGHDVTQWRTNWTFADSYAARDPGGGVLLDLCHELDMAACLFPDIHRLHVGCIGHTRFPSVDFATQVALDGPVQGVVAMDYISPISLRRMQMLGARRHIDFDLIAGTYWITGPGDTETLTFSLERNDMFLAAMRDFLALIAGRPTSNILHLPRLDKSMASADLIVTAYQERTFTGHLNGDWP